jgi:hypothetical protein
MEEDNKGDLLEEEEAENLPVQGECYTSIILRG